MARLLHGFCAVLGWLALGLQLAITARQMGLPLGLWRFLGYFTILTNLLVACVATAVFLRPSCRLASAPARLAAVSAIDFVGLVYAVALADVWNPQGLQKLADIALHTAAPIAFTLAWLAGSHPGLRWRQIGWVLPMPLGYFAYAMARGALEKWYAYWFLDPVKLGAYRMGLSIAALTAAMLAIGAVLVGVDRLFARGLGRADRRRA